MISGIETFTAAVFCAIVVSSIVRKKRLVACGANERFSAASPIVVFASRKVLGNMAGPADYFKVFNSVVILLFINVMNEFGFQQWPSNVIAHHKPVFGNITYVAMFERIGMVWSKNVHVALAGNETPALPFGVAGSLAPMATNVADAFPLCDSIESRFAWGKSGSAPAPA